MSSSTSNNMPSTSKQTQTQVRSRSRWNRNGTTGLLNLPVQSFQAYGEPLSPRRLPSTPRIRTVNLPLPSPTSGSLLDTPRYSPSYFNCLPTPPANSEIGPFQVVQQLHSGTHGSAVVAKDVGTGRRICLKVVDKSRVQDNDLASYPLRTELAAYKIIADCRPNSFVMDCHGVLQDENKVFFAMDHLKTDLHSLLGEIPDPNRVKRWVAQMAIGISSLHEIGIIHRDIKPENILVDSCDNIRISDFGTAFICNEPISPTRTYSTEYVGTRQYMAPEILKGKSYNGAVDYWALGCTVYDLIAGDTLFKNSGQLRKYMKWNSGTKEGSYFHSKTGLATEEEDLLAGLLHIDPSFRYTISDLRNHPYFFDDNGHNIFADVESKSTRYPQASFLFEEDLRLVKVSDTYYPTADPYTYASAGFIQFGWINPRGLWGVKRWL